MEPGISDNTVLELTNKEEAILLTSDKDFGEIVFREHRVTSGVVLIRLAGLSASAKSERVSIAIKKQAARLSNAFSVITPGAIRIRPGNI
jgi:predicted nuclease of predicted toxin-antitoxin system